ncbi:hypothetical protein [Hymenobacter sp. B81]|uniref:hypothetical protein n=1 Tax=Hymenobacter sp. B81 TaxID=3344878 RepID=UPI0037DCD750
MLRKLLLIAALGGLLHCVLLVAVSIFGVTWGGPKPAWLPVAAWLIGHPLSLDPFGRYFFWAAAFNGAIWATGLYLLGRALKKTTGRRADR